MEEEERRSLLGHDKQQDVHKSEHQESFSNETPLRVATDDNPAMRRKSRRYRILARRGKSPI